MDSKKKLFAWLLVFALIISAAYVPGTKVKADGSVSVAFENTFEPLEDNGYTVIYRRGENENERKVRVQLGTYINNVFTPVSINSGGGPFSAECDRDTLKDYAVYLDFTGEYTVDLIVNGAREFNRAPGRYTMLPNNFNGGTLNISVDIPGDDQGGPNQGGPNQGAPIIIPLIPIRGR